MVHFSFLEQVLLPNANGVACIEVCRHCTKVQAGAVVLLMKESNSFAIFQWRERLSDRQVCVAELPGCTASLVAASLNLNGQWGAISDSSGHLYLLDFGLFE
uniref:CNH domain-containing protein n=1 Tax=Globisporangium ultimum (strain ATCC 200006 / CBS 805.95 / DAOM BR144) TaxID=431595 RepID=K3WAR2_GLOUD